MLAELVCDSYGDMNVFELVGEGELLSPTLDAARGSVAEQENGQGAALGNVVNLSRTVSEQYSREAGEENLRNAIDSEGNELSAGQQEFFKDSKVRDKKGRLIPMYHGSEAKFTVFDTSKISTATGVPAFGEGFYFTKSKTDALGYGENTYRVFLNITNPYIAKDSEAYTLHKGKLQSLGYDGVKLGDTYVAFDSNQIKNADNLNPTESNDIRYSRVADLERIASAVPATRTESLGMDATEDANVARYINEIE